MESVTDFHERTAKLFLDATVDELEAQSFASAGNPEGCCCANNEEPCPWCKAVADWYENDEVWRNEWRQQA